MDTPNCTPIQMGSNLGSCSRRTPTKTEQVVSKDDDYDDGDITITEHARERSVYFYPDAVPVRDNCDVTVCCVGKKGRRVVRDVEHLERDV